MTDFSSESMEAKSKWYDIFCKFMTRKCQLNSLSKLLFRNEGEIKPLSNKGKFRESVASRSFFKD